MVDLCHSDRQGSDIAEIFRSIGDVPWTLQKLAVGRTFGWQLVHRAESQAILLLFEHFTRRQVFTDSATAGKVSRRSLHTALPY